MNEEFPAMFQELSAEFANEFDLERGLDRLRAAGSGIRAGKAKGDSVFISYRREDAAPYARLLKESLSRRFTKQQVFKDMDSIEPGLDFQEAIESAVRSCAVLVALIGPGWLMPASEDGRRRIDDPDDYVRFEIRTALASSVRVIPVLIDGAEMPYQHELPGDLQELAQFQALKMSHERFKSDETLLTTAIERELAAALSSSLL